MMKTFFAKYLNIPGQTIYTFDEYFWLHTILDGKMRLTSIRRNLDLEDSFIIYQSQTWELSEAIEIFHLKSPDLKKNRNITFASRAFRDENQPFLNHY